MDARHDQIVALVVELEDHVAGVVDDILVVAVAALHDVGAEAAIDMVVERRAGDGVAKLVADARRVIAGIGHDQMLDVGTQRVVLERRRYRVDSLVVVFGDDISGVVGGEEVVAVAAEHRVGSDASDEDVMTGAATKVIRAAGTLQRVVAGVAVDVVVERVAVAVDVR